MASAAVTAPPPSGVAQTHPRRSRRQQACSVSCSAQRPDLSRRRLLLGASLLLVGTPAARAGEDGSDPLDALVTIVEQTEEDVRLGSTDLVKRLLESTENNRDANRKVLPLPRLPLIILHRIPHTAPGDAWMHLQLWS